MASALLWPYSAENRFLISRLSHSAECSKRIFRSGGQCGKQNFYSNNAKAARPPGRGSLAAGSYSTGFMLAGSSTAPGCPAASGRRFMPPGLGEQVGRVNTKRHHSPCWLSTRICPPDRLTSTLQMFSPRPEPRAGAAADGGFP